MQIFTLLFERTRPVELGSLVGEEERDDFVVHRDLALQGKVAEISKRIRRISEIVVAYEREGS